MKVITSNVIYENPLPQLRSRQSLFPFACEWKDGSLLALCYIGEEMESVDGTTYASKSFDGGITWSEPKPILDKNQFGYTITDTCKPVVLEDGRIIAIGYGFIRENPDFPEGNPKTGGLLDDIVFYLVSEDHGETWSVAKEITCSWGPHVEASAPLAILQDGTWMTPITGFADWNGNMTGRNCGRALCSKDEGKTWNDDSVCMEFTGDKVTCFEQRMCQLESGAIICIGWNENLETGERMENHYTVSYDNGKTWEKPKSTGILGQAASVCTIGGEKLLALHAVRRDTDRPGIYACVVDFSERTWNIMEQDVIWEPVVPVMKNSKFAEIFSFLKFGQPGAIRLSNGEILMTHWYAQDGEYKTVATKIQL